jgi:16S rRNA (adenine1518-N6/adenine1519-N6)-dimethyltransferase
VESNVIVINRNDKTFNDNWSQFIRKCFAYKRKTLINNLKGFFPISDIKKILEKLNISLTIRSEQLSGDMLFKLYKRLER